MDHKIIGGDVEAKAGLVSGRTDATVPNPSQPPKRGALVEDETLVGRTDGGVETRQPDGKIEERATDARENRK